MNLELSKISEYKNKLCIGNLLFCIALISLDYTRSEYSAKSIIGIIFAILSPIVWDQWLYRELFPTGKGAPLMSCRTFLWIGFFGALLMSISVLVALFRGTL